jgi:hypothetical protein
MIAANRFYYANTLADMPLLFDINANPVPRQQKAIAAA